MADACKRQRVSDDPLAQVTNEDALQVLRGLGRFDFDVLSLEELLRGRQLCVTAGESFRQRGLLEELHAEGCFDQSVKSKLGKYLGQIEDRYVSTVAYHNATHAADTLATAWWLLQATYFSELSNLDRFIVVVACAIHDVAHPGRNNVFQSKVMSETAIRYNDRAILENMHSATAFEIMLQDESLNWFSTLSKDFKASNGKTENLQQYTRKGLVDLVLGTDMAKHKEHEEFVKSLSPGKALDGTKLMPILECVVHAADVSNACKPAVLMKQWTQRLLLEFWEQGDEEMSRGLEISHLCDREAGLRSIAKGQFGFVNFVIEPYFRSMAAVIKEAEEATESLARNKAFWSNADSEGTSPDDLFGVKDFGR